VSEGAKKQVPGNRKNRRESGCDFV